MCDAGDDAYCDDEIVCVVRACVCKQNRGFVLLLRRENKASHEISKKKETTPESAKGQAVNRRGKRRVGFPLACSVCMCVSRYLYITVYVCVSVYDSN